MFFEIKRAVLLVSVFLQLIEKNKQFLPQFQDNFQILPKETKQHKNQTNEKREHFKKENLKIHTKPNITHTKKKQTI